MHNLPLVTTIAAAFTAAWILGLITQKLRLSPIVGYLLGGIAIGPHTPGFVGDIGIATQLAEVGVILLMFGVGLHFHLKDLLAVKNVAIPGAIGQSLFATLLGIPLALAVGWPLQSGLAIGIAMAVASTVVLIRVLTDNHQLDTPHGSVAVGWLIVEDILTVIVLVLIPALAGHGGEATASIATISKSLAIALLKLGALVGIVFLAGSTVIPWIMVKVAELRSRELFTLTVLVMAMAIATGSAYIFGASMALGAFLAGMVVGQSAVSHQAAADALPMRDAFAVLFFASVGMLFDPMFIVHNPLLTLAGLGIVLVGKPLAAMTIIAVIGYPIRTGLTVAIGLAQIGEFSFILSELARHHKLLGDDGHNLLVACAILSITINPLLFRAIKPIEQKLQRFPRLWKLLDRGSTARQQKMNSAAESAITRDSGPLAVVLGFGPVGRTVDRILRDSGIETVVVDLNMNTIRELTSKGRAAIYGDAYNIEVMAQAIPRATHLVITLPHSANRNPLIATAKLINPSVKVFVRARYISEQDELKQVGADESVFEEGEAAVALAKLVMTDRGASDSTIRKELRRIRRETL